MIFDESCSHCKKDQKVIVSKENQNEHILHNNYGYMVFQYRVDGEIVKDGKDERCDYIVEAQKISDLLAYFIELKGSDLNKALDQIEAAIYMLDDRLRGYKVLPRVVIHRAATHEIQGTRYRRFKKCFPDLVVKCKRLEEVIQ